MVETFEICQMMIKTLLETLLETQLETLLETLLKIIEFLPRLKNSIN